MRYADQGVMDLMAWARDMRQLGLLEALRVLMPPRCTTCDMPANFRSYMTTAGWLVMLECSTAGGGCPNPRVDVLVPTDVLINGVVGLDWQGGDWTAAPAPRPPRPSAGPPRWSSAARPFVEGFDLSTIVGEVERAMARNGLGNPPRRRR